MNAEEKRLLKLAYLIIRSLPINARNQSFIDAYLELEKKQQQEIKQLSFWEHGHGNE